MCAKNSSVRCCNAGVTALASVKIRGASTPATSPRPGAPGPPPRLKADSLCQDFAAASPTAGSPSLRHPGSPASLAFEPPPLFVTSGEPLWRAVCHRHRFCECLSASCVMYGCMKRVGA
eukprot:318063-Chlamydomonas_euryale.AAC.1